MINFVEELRWRGMMHDIMPGTEEELNKGMASGYIGFDPTGDSLHVGSLVQIMILVHFQRCGHKPYALVGGATGMVGDPSGKSEERNLLSEDVLSHNLKCIQKQLEQFLSFDEVPNKAEVVNNYDWFKDMSFLDFIRDIGKHITVNYMMAKDSVKKRLETGLSFTEFTYQLVQGYDFYWLNKHKNCIIQMGGSDQWGNIVTGTELIRRMDGGTAFAMTTPLITKSDGGKFGKTESGNIWLDREKTSPYKFYQFWRNANDEDASKYIRIFTLRNKEEIEALEEAHKKEPHLWLLQEELAKDVTTLVHSKEDYELAKEASEILFGKATAESLHKIPEKSFLEVFEGVPQATVSRSKVEAGENIVDFLSDSTGFLKSKGEAKRALKENSISVNKEKVQEDFTVGKDQLISNKFIVLQRGKRNYFLVVVE